MFVTDEDFVLKGSEQIQPNRLIGTNFDPDTQIVEEFWKAGCWRDVNS
jgi:hypothetical protein